MRAISTFLCALGLATLGVACSSNGDGKSRQLQQQPPESPLVTVESDIKQLIFSWAEVSGATYYRLFENPDGHSGFTRVGTDIPAGTVSVTLNIAVHLHDFTNALYMVEACNANGCNGSTEVSAINVMLGTIGYFRAFDYDAGDGSGAAVALSADGHTIAVGAYTESSNASGINGNQNDNSAPQSGAVNIFRFDGTRWSQQAYVKASNTDEDDQFGWAIALSADGNTLAVGARNEDSSAIGINGNQSDNSIDQAGAAYVFRFDGTDWYQQAYIKASSNDDDEAYFGHSISLSADGDTLAAGAPGTDRFAGAVYLFRFNGTDWNEHAFIQGSNTGTGAWGIVDYCDYGLEWCYGDFFGIKVSLNADANTLAIAAPGEDSDATGINGDQDNDRADGSGAVYLFRFNGTVWSQQAYIKASNTDIRDNFGGFDSGTSSVTLSGDGNTLVVAASKEDSNASGLNSNQDDNSAAQSGAVYIFGFDGANWSQSAYVKASNAGEGMRFGRDIAISGDASTVAVTTSGEGGPVFIFQVNGTTWSQQAAVQTTTSALAIALSTDGETLAVGGTNEDGDGAVYLY